VEPVKPKILEKPKYGINPKASMANLNIDLFKEKLICH